MSDQGEDVSWRLVEQVVRDWLGTSARLHEMTFLSGGTVNTTIALKTYCGERAVLKMSPHRVNRSHEREAKSLQRMSQLGIPVPQVYATRTATLESPHSYLLLQFVSGMTFRDAKTHLTAEQLEAIQIALADCVAAMHGETAETYGRVGDEPFADWQTFFRSLVDPIWHEAEKQAGLPVKIRKTIARVHARLDVLLAHEDVPRLCHGDLWGGNILCEADADGRWRLCAIIDPDLRYSHAEAEIAYLDLFKTITPAFKQVYQQHFRLCDRYYAVRRPIYQLYGLLNQFQMHGAAYASPLIAAVEKVSAIV